MSTCKEIDCCPSPFSPDAVRYQSGGSAIPQSGFLIDLAFQQLGSTAKFGYAATGVDVLDFWNTYNQAQANTPLALKWSNGDNSPASIQNTGQSQAVWGVNGNVDPMMGHFIENATGNHQKSFTITGLPSGNWDLYFYGFGSVTGSIGGVPNASGLWLIQINGVQWPNNMAFWSQFSNLSPPPYTRQVPPHVGNYAIATGIPITSGDILQITCVYGGGFRNGRISGMQLFRGPDSPTDIVEPDIFSATPAFFSGGVNLVSGTYRVVRLNGGIGYDILQPTVWQTNSSATNGYRIVHSGGVEIESPGTYLHYTSQFNLEQAEQGFSVDFTHIGGSISVHMKDSIASDNMSGSPNTRFGLIRLS